DRGVRHAPGVVKAQYSGLLIHAKVSAAVPIFRFTHGANRRFQTLRCVVRIGEAAAYRMLQRPQLFRALARGDVLADAAVTDEIAGIVEYRRSADADPEGFACLASSSQLDVAKGLARVHDRLVSGPVGLRHVERVLVPAPLADQPRRQ